MNIPTAPVSFMSAMRTFFGMKDGQTVLDFAKEVKILTDADRAYFKAGLEKAGFIIQPTP